MRSIELFTGAGGLALGTQLAGFHHEALVEFNASACRTLRTNSRRGALPGIAHWQVHEADIKKFAFAPYQGVDLIAGGVPCQPFSLGGKHRGMNDERDMFPHFVRAVRELRPSAFIVENVKGLLRESFASYFSYIKLQLEHPELLPIDGEIWQDHLARLVRHHTSAPHDELSYNVVFQLLNAADFGVPQRRERVFIVGFRSDLGIEWNFPTPTHSRASLARVQAIGTYWARHEVQPRRVIDAQLSINDGLKPWRTIRDVISDLPEPVVGKPTVFNHELRLGARSYPGHTGSDVDLPSKTLKAGVHGVPGGENTVVMADGHVRYLTVREAARIQTFPDSWVFEGPWGEAMRQLGNAVPMELARVVADSVATTMAQHKALHN